MHGQVFKDRRRMKAIPDMSDPFAEEGSS